MSERTKEEILERARRLLEIRPDRGAAPSEVEKAEAALAELLREHDLNLYDVEAKTYSEGIVENGYPALGEKVPAWQGQLAAYLTEAFDCTCIYVTTNGVQHIRLIGHDTDVTICRYYLAVLSSELYFMALEAATEEGVTQKPRRERFIRDYVSSAASKIAERLKPKEETPPAGDTSTALVQVKSAALDKYVAEHYPNLRTTRGPQNYDWDAMALGNEAGTASIATWY